jgi:hypothetical protein
MRIATTLALVALVALAACRPTPAPQAQGDLEQLVRTCQEKTGLNFTYTEETAKLLRAKAIPLEATDGRSSEEWMAYLRSALAAQKLELARVGPEHLAVWLVRPVQKGG